MKSIINKSRLIFRQKNAEIRVFLPLFAIFVNMCLLDSSEAQAYLEKVI